jgi:hypothetical protein
MEDDIKTTGEASKPLKKTSSSSKYDLYPFLYPFLGVIFSDLKYQKQGKLLKFSWGGGGRVIL